MTYLENAVFRLATTMSYINQDYYELHDIDWFNPNKKGAHTCQHCKKEVSKACGTNHEYEHEINCPYREMIIALNAAENLCHALGTHRQKEKVN